MSFFVPLAFQGYALGVRSGRIGSLRSPIRGLMGVLTSKAALRAGSFFVPMALQSEALGVVQDGLAPYGRPSGGGCFIFKAEHVVLCLFLCPWPFKAKLWGLFRMDWLPTVAHPGGGGASYSKPSTLCFAFFCALGPSKRSFGGCSGWIGSLRSPIRGGVLHIQSRARCALPFFVPLALQSEALGPGHKKSRSFLTGFDVGDTGFEPVTPCL